MFLGALVALPVAALVACGAASERPDFVGFDENDGGAGASTGRADEEPGQTITGDSGTAAPVAKPGEIDLTTVTPCDADLDVDGEVEDFLKAIGLCHMAESDEDWGVLEAKFVANVGSDSPSAADEQHGILEEFGSVLVPREGDRLGVLSTGWGREYNSNSGSSAKFRAGQSFGSAGGDVPEQFAAQAARDLINLRIKLRVPTNAKSFSFDFNFHSSEWPAYVSSDKDDHFIAYLTDSSNPEGTNISFDSQNNPVSVNLTGEFFDRCVPDMPVGCSGNTTSTSTCAGGPDELEGTGFGGRTIGCGASNSGWGGATGWLTTQSPVTGGDEITIEFAIWDADDTIYDSLVLIDNFKWDATAVTTGTARPPN